MVLTVLRDTPYWVWCVLGLLIWRGYALTKPQHISVRRLFTLPAAFLVISFVAAVTTFNVSAAVIPAWLLGATAVTLAWASRPRPEGVVIDATTHTFYIPGTSAPLVLIIAAFCVRYGIGIALARHPTLHESVPFSLGSAFIFGSVSGAFLGRAANIFGARNFAIVDKLMGQQRTPREVL